MVIRERSSSTVGEIYLKHAHISLTKFRADFVLRGSGNNKKIKIKRCNENERERKRRVPGNLSNWRADVYTRARLMAGAGPAAARRRGYILPKMGTIVTIPDELLYTHVIHNGHPISLFLFFRLPTRLMRARARGRGLLGSRKQNNAGAYEPRNTFSPVC